MSGKQFFERLYMMVEFMVVQFKSEIFVLGVEGVCLAIKMNQPSSIIYPQDRSDFMC